jgi:peptidoglycan/xylan/chitin deacetylase (PgdA/CDA1 family)
LLTIVMYHYVRDLPRSRFPRIKGLTIERFEGQLDHLQKHYTVCSLAQVRVAAQGGAALPHNACLLTFDDGFADHYATVFPRLDERGLVGSFFPPARPLAEAQVLDTHRIHFILAASEDPAALVRQVFALLAPHRRDHDLPPDDELYATYATTSRFDPPEIVFLKRLLQRGLPEAVRADLCSQLFAQTVTADEAAFARELYMDLDQLRCLARHGMEIGGHGYRHEWLESLSAEEQGAEIAATVALLASVYGQPPADWTMSYPFGSYDETTLALLPATGCALGLTSKVGLVEDLSRPLELARLDTNDLPVAGDAPVCDWTLRAQRA